MASPRKAASAPKPPAPEAWEGAHQRLLEALDQPDVRFVPIRHHSPACAWHLRRLIRERRPATILIEGPESFDRFLPLLADPALQAPVALYVQFVDRQGLTRPKLEEGDEPDDSPVPRRYGSYFPLCDYSPELVAIREGQAIGARLAFCDLDYPQLMVAQASHGERSRVGSLLDERYLAQSTYLRELAQRSGCRDFNEWWDRHFECDFQSADTHAFWRRVASYCFFARCNAPASELRSDGTLHREQRMAELVADHRKRLKRAKASGPLLVVTGGFHTPPLALGEAAAVGQARRLSIPEADVLVAPMAYSLPQLDALNGYGAGMVSPGFYQRLWDASEPEPGARLTTIARTYLTELARATREKGLAQPLSTADIIAAHQQACTLARFRGNPGPLREDLLDGIRSSMVKGSLDAEGATILAMARELLCGDTVGKLPSSAPVPPLVQDFRHEAEKLGLKLDTPLPKALALEVYTKERHQRISRFFHLLQFLDIPFARLLSGPDFVGGHSLDLQIEHWEYYWRPQTESRLVEQTLYGAQLAEAVLGRLHEQQARLRASGATGSSLEAVGLLLFCCRLGLAEQAHQFVPFVYEQLAGESQFADLALALSKLDQLDRYRSPLEQTRLTMVPEILRAAYARACYHVGNFSHLPEGAVRGVLEHLPILAEVVRVDTVHPRLDPDHFWGSCEQALQADELEPTVRGGLVGLLWSSGRREADDIIAQLQAQNLSQDAKGNCLTRFVSGLFALCREATWNDRGFMRAFNQLLMGWPHDAFHRALPELRLAFTQHTPQETDRVARLVAEINGQASIGEWFQRELDEDLVLRAMAAENRLRETLKQDHLENLIPHG